VGFCWTNDSRSIEIIIRSMATRLSREFEEKYLAAPDFAFDRDETAALMRRVKAGEPGFYNDSIRLLARMSASIFNAAASGSLLPQAACTIPRKVSRLEIATENRWNEIGQRFAAEPVLPYAWHPDHCLCLPQGAEIELLAESSGQHAYSLVFDGRVFASIGFSAATTWVPGLMARLCNHQAQRNTLQAVADALNVTPKELAAVLDALLQCGFITTPELAERPSFSVRKDILQSVFSRMPIGLLLSA
jgi:hypothetical protein